MHSFACGHSVVPAPFVEKCLLSLSLHPVENKLATVGKVCFCTLCTLILLNCMSVIMPVPHCLIIYCSFVVSFEMRKCECSNILFFFKILLAIQGLVYFHINFKISFSISAKKKPQLRSWSELCWLYRSIWRVLLS